MGCPSPSPENRPLVDTTEQTRCQLIEVIQRLPANAALFHDLLDLVRFITRPRTPYPVHTLATVPEQTRVCSWVLSVGSWVLWLL